ncbi:cytochrome P450 [Flavisphingomonas formosensis]|uniref:cytochrome P450 n=1 Tax=Flavisphingomonas formosensis TaxID=861534 RepID=UPI0018DF26D1|nr:cytochrome P450 [Sphingomonas formosensis]
MATAWPLPDVPTDQILDFDFFQVEPVDGDLHAGYHRYHDGPPLFYTPHNGGHWVATRAELIYEIFRDYDRFSNRGIALFRDPGDEPHFIPGELDPPIHGGFRTHLNPELSPRRVRAFQDRARELTRELIEDVAAKGSCEFQVAIGTRMPIYNYLAFIGLPLEDADLLLEHVEIIGRSADFQAFQAALGFVQDYLADQIAQRRRTPVDDFLGRLAFARIGDREITSHEAKVTALNVVLGGLDTVTASMGFFMNFLARNPGHRRQLLDDRDLIPEAMEELLRRHGIFNTARLVREDVDFHGTLLRKNDLVMVPTTLYNLDPARFERPLDVDFRRPDKNHMTFAVGIHRCLGSNFARIQLQVLLEEWLKRIPDFAIAPGAETVMKSGRTNSVMELPLVW